MAIAYDVAFVPASKRAPKLKLRSKSTARRRFAVACIYMSVFVTVGGLIHYAVYDPQYNLGRDVMNYKTAELRFKIADRTYTVRSPNVPLTKEEIDAYWYYVRAEHLPTYAADGPMAVDP